MGQVATGLVKPRLSGSGGVESRPKGPNAGTTFLPALHIEHWKAEFKVNSGGLVLLTHSCVQRPLFGVKDADTERALK